MRKPTTIWVIFLCIVMCACGSDTTNLYKQFRSTPPRSTSEFAHSGSLEDSVYSVVEKAGSQLDTWLIAFGDLDDVEALTHVYPFLVQLKYLLEGIASGQITHHAARATLTALRQTMTASITGLSAGAQTVIVGLASAIGVVFTIGTGSVILLSITERGLERSLNAVDSALQNKTLEKIACVYGALSGPSLAQTDSDYAKFISKLISWWKANAEVLAAALDDLAGTHYVCGRLRYKIADRRYVGPALQNMTIGENGSSFGYRPIRRMKVQLVVGIGFDTLYTTTNDNGFFFFPVGTSATADGSLQATIQVYPQMTASVNKTDGIAPDACIGASWDIQHEVATPVYRHFLTLKNDAAYNGFDFVIDLVDVKEDNLTGLQAASRMIQIDHMIEALEFICRLQDNSLQLPPLVLEDGDAASAVFYGAYERDQDADIWKAWMYYEDVNHNVSPYYLYQIVGHHYLDDMGRNDAQHLDRTNDFAVGSLVDARVSLDMGWAMFFSAAVANTMIELPAENVRFDFRIQGYSYEGLKANRSHRLIYDPLGVALALWELYLATENNLDRMLQVIQSLAYDHHRGLTNPLVYFMEYESLFGSNPVESIAENYLTIPLYLLEDPYDKENKLGNWYAHHFPGKAADELMLYDHHICPDMISLPSNVEYPDEFAELQGMFIALPDEKAKPPFTNKIVGGVASYPLKQYRWHLCDSGQTAAIRDDKGYVTYTMTHYELGIRQNESKALRPTLRVPQDDEKHVYVITSKTAESSCYSTYTYGCDEDDEKQTRLRSWIETIRDDIVELSLPEAQ